MIIAKDYSFNDYKNDINIFGLKETWLKILNSFNDRDYNNGILNINSISELYESGLALDNLQNKKSLGQYYTPTDISLLLSKYFQKLPGENICDICAGCGNLIISYLSLYDIDDARKIIQQGNIYLYDIDALALTIAKKRIELIYGVECSNSINYVCVDFLDSDVHIPKNSKVISNPAYAHLSKVPYNWDASEIVKQSKELYAAFFEKILKESISSVIITPYSFIGSEKFSKLRKEMNKYNGFIISFDNSPGNIFKGKKQGITNTNTVNSVRAAITIVENKPNKKGFRVSGLIRFKNCEREELLTTDKLSEFVGNKYQIVDSIHDKFYKCFPEQESLLEKWLSCSNVTLKNNVLSIGKYALCVPNSCRYYTVATEKDLSRTGKYFLYTNDESYYHYLHCYLCSSFNYWNWRLIDGGVTYPKKTLLQMPDFYKSINNDDLKKLISLSKKLFKEESKYLVYKKNAGAMQENVKFPEKYRKEIDDILLKIIGYDKGPEVFDFIYSSTALR